MVGSGGNESIFESFRTSDEVRNGDIGRCHFQTDTFTQAPIQHNLNKVGIPFFGGCQWPGKTSFQHLLNLVAMARSIWPWRNGRSLSSRCYARKGSVSPVVGVGICDKPVSELSNKASRQFKNEDE